MDNSGNDISEIFDELSSFSEMNDIIDFDDFSDSILDEFLEESSIEMKDEDIDMITEYMSFEEINNFDK
jgi:hypothetical protein